MIDVDSWTLTWKFSVLEELLHNKQLQFVPISRLQNQLGVSVLFTWGVISENNSNHIAIVPGGWNEDYLQDSETYVKVIKLFLKYFG